MARKFVKASIGFAAGAANGLFGAGGGILLVPALQKYLKIEAHKSHATALAVIFPLSLLSILFYMRGGSTPWEIIIWVSAGGIAGGYIGAKMLNKVKTPWLHRIFGICMAAAAIRMIF